MPEYIKVGSEIKEVKLIYIKDSGIIKSVKEKYVKVSGVTQKVFSTNTNTQWTCTKVTGNVDGLTAGTTYEYIINSQPYSSNNVSDLTTIDLKSNITVSPGDVLSLNFDPNFHYAIDEDGDPDASVTFDFYTYINNSNWIDDTYEIDKDNWSSVTGSYTYKGTTSGTLSIKITLGPGADSSDTSSGINLDYFYLYLNNKAILILR
jgi:hypothetical protein